MDYTGATGRTRRDDGPKWAAKAPQAANGGRRSGEASRAARNDRRPAQPPLAAGGGRRPGEASRVMASDRHPPQPPPAAGGGPRPAETSPAVGAHRPPSGASPAANARGRPSESSRGGHAARRLRRVAAWLARARSLRLRPTARLGWAAALAVLVMAIALVGGLVDGDWLEEAPVGESRSSQNATGPRTDFASIRRGGSGEPGTPLGDSTRALIISGDRPWWSSELARRLAASAELMVERARARQQRARHREQAARRAQQRRQRALARKRALAWRRPGARRRPTEGRQGAQTPSRPRRQPAPAPSPAPSPAAPPAYDPAPEVTREGLDYAAKAADGVGAPPGVGNLIRSLP